MLVNGRCNVLREHCEKSNYAALYYMSRRDFMRKLHNLENSETLRQQMGEKGRHYVQEDVYKRQDNRNGNSFRAKFDKDDHGGWIGY